MSNQNTVDAAPLLIIVQAAVLLALLTLIGVQMNKRGLILKP